MTSTLSFQPTLSHSISVEQLFSNTIIHLRFHTTSYRPLLPSVMINHFFGTISGADFCKLNRCLSTRLTPMGSWEHTLQISPGKNDNLHSATAAFTVWDLGSIGLSLVLESRPSQVSLICDFCSSARNFAHRELFIPQSGFLQIPSRDGHPCLRLMLPTTKRIVDFHHQVIAHAGRTNLKWQVPWHLPFLSYMRYARATSPKVK